MTGQWREFDWNGRTARSWMPDPLGSRDFDFPPATIRAAEQATAAIALSDRARPPHWEPLARLLLRTEGIASSSIEGVRAPVVDIAIAELAPALGDAGWVADNLAAATHAMNEQGPLSVEHLHRWHAELMGHSALAPEMIGAFREAPSWIGGTSPLDAAFVPPPAQAVPDLVDSLIDYANSDHFDPVTQAALVHAQFETIHPYGDGNGRLGRILIGWVLRHRGVTAELPPPISVLIGRDPGGHISGLHLFREGPTDRYVRWFADVAKAAAAQSTTMIQIASETVSDWESEVADLRADAAARTLVPLLPRTPVLTASIAADLLNTSERSGRTALELLEDRGILVAVEPHSLITRRGRTPNYYAATKLLDAIAGWAT